MRFLLLVEARLVGAHLCVAAALLCGAAWAQATNVEVRDESGAPVGGAEVFRNCTLAGMTGANGRLVINLNQGDRLAARKLIKTGTAIKGQHDGWSYRVYLTNVRQENDGTQVDHLVTSPESLQVLTLRKDQAQIGLNLVGSVFYNATPENLQNIAQGMRDASRYLFDLSDGQLFFERFTLYEAGQHLQDADMQFYVDEWPNAHVGGLHQLGQHIRLPGPGFNGLGNPYLAWTWPNGFRTIIHEFGHYGIGAYDEYFRTDSMSMQVKSLCTKDQATQPLASRASAMDSQYHTTEFCHDGNHNSDTEQGQRNKRSVWGTLEQAWQGAGYTLRTPMSRGEVNPGPNELACTAQLTTQIVPVAAFACPPIPLKAKLLTSNAPGINVTLYKAHSSDIIPQGRTNDLGELSIYGAAPGDTLHLSRGHKNGGIFSSFKGSATIEKCEGLEVPLMLYVNIRYYPLPKLKIPGPVPELILELPINGDPLRHQLRFEAQVHLPGGRPQPVTLTYRPREGVLAGRLPLDLGSSSRFLLDVHVQNDAGQTSGAAFQYEGALFHRGGPGEGPLGKTPPSGAPPPAWELFAPDGPVGLTVTPASLPPETSVLVGETAVPAEVPEGLVIMAGPYSIQGDHPVSGQLGLRLPYRTQDFCGARKGSVAIYRLEADTFQPVRTSTVDEARGLAFASVDAWGVYAVLGAPARGTHAPPTLRCPEPLQLTVPAGERGATASLQEPHVEDACSGTRLVGARQDGQPLDAPFPPGRTVVRWTATAQDGRQATCEQIVEVQLHQVPNVDGSGCRCALGGVHRAPGSAWLLLLGAAAVLGWRLRLRSSHRRGSRGSRV
ncbi:MAG: HYR domain-containing protein [Myxococcales bacterium]|nr:HYR domain-containing protein [Myxococcota bacterium]MDW8282665.1 HYR domain-containing protein [Myxococcales bacterium]